MNYYMFEDLYAKIKEVGPVWIWGVGSYAREIEKRLKENSIQVLGHFVDIEGKYRNEVHCRNVATLEKLMNGKEPINVVVGHGHSELAEKLSNIEIIKNIWVVPNPYTQYYPSKVSIQKMESRLPELETMLWDEESRYNLKAWLSLYQETFPWEKFYKNPYSLIKSVFEFQPLQLTHNENYIDCGAWDGDTVLQFSKSVKQCYQNIVAIEPGDDGFRRLTENTKSMRNIITLQYALGKDQGVMYMENEDTQSAFCCHNGKGKMVNVLTIDDVCKNYNISPSLIKIGIPVTFYDTLRGARNIIETQKPRIIIGINWDDCSHVCEVIEYLSRHGYRVALRYTMRTSTQVWCYGF